MDDSQEFVGNWTTHWRIRKLLFVDFRTLKERQVLKRNVANVFSVKCRAENRSGLSRFSLRQFAFSRVFQFSTVSLLARIFFPAIPRNRWKQRWEGQGKAQRIKKTKKNIDSERTKGREKRREKMGQVWVWKGGWVPRWTKMVNSAPSQYPDSGPRPRRFSSPVLLHLQARFSASPSCPDQPFIPFFLFQCLVHVPLFSPAYVPISPSLLVLSWSISFRGPPHQAAFRSSPPPPLLSKLSSQHDSRPRKKRE